MLCLRGRLWRRAGSSWLDSLRVRFHNRQAAVAPLKVRVRIEFRRVGEEDVQSRMLDLNNLPPGL